MLGFTLNVSPEAVEEAAVELALDLAFADRIEVVQVAELLLGDPRVLAYADHALRGSASSTRASVCLARVYGET